MRPTGGDARAGHREPRRPASVDPAMEQRHPEARQRVAAGAITLGAHALLLTALLFALGRDHASAPRPEILPFTLSEAPPPPPPPPPHRFGSAPR